MVTNEYLEKVRFGLRRNQGTDIDSEITDVIEQCRAALVLAGVQKTAAEDETNKLVLGAVRCYARWQTGSSEDPDLDRQDYERLASDLRLSSDYGTFNEVTS